MQAYDFMNCTRLAAVVFDLKSEGHNIVKEDMRSPSGALYAKYHLMGVNR
jgi:hypothetical protein